MEQLVRVKSVYEDGKALVVHVRQSACSGDCHKCSGCGAAQEAVSFLADNSIGAEPGDLVRVESESAIVLKGAAVLYMIPLVLFFLGYYLGFRLGRWEAAFGGLGFLLGIAGAVAYDRLYLRKQNIRYIIKALAGDSGHGAGKREGAKHG